MTDFAYHKQEERRIAKMVADSVGLEDEEITDEFSHSDRYFRKNGTRVAIVEVKGRGAEYSLGKLGSMMVDELKVDKLMAQGKSEGLPVAIIQEYADGVFYYWLKDEVYSFRKEYGGRTKKTRFPKDIKWVYYIPKERCKKI